MKKIILLLCCLGMLAGCKHKASEDHIPEDQMQKILFDVQLAEAYSTIVKKDTLHKQISRNMDSLSYYYKEILAHHKVTEAQFDSSLNWYRQHPDELDTIYTRMLPDFEKLQVAYKLK